MCEVRRTATWMELLDDRILECLAAQDWGSPRTISDAMPFEVLPGYVRSRLEKLARAGLAAPLYEGTDHYEITTWGRRYLDGELDANHHSPVTRFRARYRHGTLPRV